MRHILQTSIEFDTTQQEAPPQSERSRRGKTAQVPSMRFRRQLRRTVAHTHAKRAQTLHVQHMRTDLKNLPILLQPQVQTLPEKEEIRLRVLRQTFH